MPRPYGEPNSGSYQIDYQTLCSSPALAGVENMDILELDIRRLEETPPLQVFQRGRDDWYKQATSQQRYHGSPSEWVACPWRGDICSNDHRDGNAGFCSPSICGSGPTQNIPLDDISSPRSLGRSSHYGTVGSCDTLESYGSSNTSYSQPGATGSDSIDPELMESDSPLGSSHQISLTGEPLVASPGGLASTASSPTLFDYPGSPAAQATVCATHSADDYFGHNPNYSQYLVKQEQQLASGPQGQEPYLGLSTGSLVSSLHPPPPPPPPPSPPPPPPLPHQPTHHGDEGGAIAHHSNSNPNACCGVIFGRRTDLERHKRTTRGHTRGGRGPTCPVKGCRYTSKFTRNDNFRAHCRKKHGMSNDKIDTYLRERKY